MLPACIQYKILSRPLFVTRDMVTSEHLIITHFHNLSYSRSLCPVTQTDQLFPHKDSDRLTLLGGHMGVHTELYPFIRSAPLFGRWHSSNK